MMEAVEVPVFDVVNVTGLVLCLDFAGFGSEKMDGEQVKESIAAEKGRITQNHKKTVG